MGRGRDSFGIKRKETGKMDRLMNARLTAVIALLGCIGSANVAYGQSLSAPILALYPREAGELVFIDLQEARRSPYFDQVQAQLMPQSFHTLQQVAVTLDVDFNRNVDRLSWAYVDAKGDAAKSEFMGVAEGNFDPSAIARAAKEHTLPVSRYLGMRVFRAGSTDDGREFVIAFTPSDQCLFGYRDDVEAMLKRAARGGANVMNNDTMRQLVDDVNHDWPIWMVMNGDFTQLGMRQLLADAIRMPGVETLSTRVHTATVRMALDRGLAAKIAAHCATSADALWFSSLLQGALVIERQMMSSKNPPMARVLGNSQVQRDEDKVNLDVSVPESDLAALIQTNGLALHF
jgi:hypothetical protein